MYSTLDTKNTSKLYLVRKGWFSRQIELTDGFNSYGKIIYHQFSKRIATVITASNTYIFKRADNSYRQVSVTDENGVIIGIARRDFFSDTTILSLQTGFVGKFRKPSIWSQYYTCESVGYGNVIRIDSHPFSLKDTISIDQSTAPALLIPLLTFFGSYLVILKRRRNTAIMAGLLSVWWGSHNVIH